MSVLDIELQESSGTDGSLPSSQYDQANCSSRGSIEQQDFLGSFCEPVWDGLYCWPAASAGETIRINCSIALATEEPYMDEIEGEAFRVCNKNGSWVMGNYTNYTECIDSLHASWDFNERSKYWVETLRKIVFAGSITSIVFLGVCLWIYSNFKIFNSKRVIIFKHLMVSVLLKSIIWVMITGPRILPIDFSHHSLGWVCNLLISIHYYSMITSVAWTVVLGLYLNSRLRGVGKYFKLSPYKISAWGIPLVITLIWHIIMVSESEQNNETCWTGYGSMGIFWIVSSPIFASMLVNSIVLMRIMYIVLTGIKYIHTSMKQQLRESVKIFVVLFLLLGINNLLFMYNPGGELTGLVLIIHAVSQSIQGTLISIFCCFMSREVRRILRTALAKVNTRNFFLETN